MGEREKSALYPSFTLSDCIDFVSVIDSYKAKTVSYKAVAEKYGLSSVTTKSFTQKIGSAKQYGLIITSNSTIQITELARNILYPLQSDIFDLKAECFSLPPLYAHLIEEFEGKAIPSESILANLLMSKYKISKVAKDHAAKIFIQNAEELGYIKAGVFSRETEEKMDTAENKEFLTIEEPRSVDADNSELLVEKEKKDNSAEYITQTYPVESGKIAKIVIPIDSTEDDLLAIRDLLEVVMKRKFKIKTAEDNKE